jgi:hypothetical protein
MPEDKQAYVGNWNGKGMSLTITEAGYVSFEKNENGVKKSVSGPISKFDGDKFIVGIVVADIAFDVRKAPYQENGAWKMNIDGVDLVKIDADTNKKIPDDKTLNSLVNESFSNFNASVIKNDFTIFYKNISKFWQAQTSAQELKKIFQAFIDNEIDLTDAIKNGIAYSNKPHINENGSLVLEGYYASKPITYFELKFTFENPNWKLVGFSCQIK